MQAMPIRNAQSNAEPSILWHYTNSTGLVGILTEHRLRCGNVQFLNDQTEHIYGWGMVRRQLQVFRCGDPICSAIAREAARLIAEGQTIVVSYAVSLSQLGDAVSQWQRYGNEGSGYAIGFDAIKLKDFCSRNPQIARFARMVYNRKHQRRAIAAPLVAWHAAMPTHAGISGARPRALDESLAHQTPPPLDHNALAVALAIQLANVVMTLKHKDFADELEWRLIRLSTRSQVEGAPPFEVPIFSATSNYVKPYLNLPLAEPEQDPHLPILEIRCGPRLASHLATSSVRALLDAKGYQSARVSNSRLRRTWR